MGKTIKTILIGMALLICGACAGGNAPPPAEAQSQPGNENAQEAAVKDSGTPAAPTSLELARLMGYGINLGNTMEAYGHKSLGVKADLNRYEQLWGQPITTQEMVSGMKAAGFKTLRIPVAWTNGMDFQNGDYTIREDLIARVGEIITYALNEDMYVVVNDHWDGGWWGMFSSANEATRQRAMDLYVAMWTQLAESYNQYDHRLIFEAANEELGNRFNDLDFAPDGGKLSADECYKLLTVVTQRFVDVVRGTGGNNADRFLLIPGYNTDIDMTVDDRFIMPTDTADSKLLLSLHYYTPWGFCGNESLSSWGTAKNYEEQNGLLEKLTRFTDMGYGVVLGEYAVAFNADGTVKNNTKDFYENFLNNCDVYGYTPLLWDTNGMYSKERREIIDPGVAALFKDRSLEARADMTTAEIIDQAQVAIAWAYRKAQNQQVVAVVSEDEALAWLMYNSGDWSLMYSVGDAYDPTAISGGMTATDVKIDGAGTYTVALDFTGTDAGYAEGVVFSALGIANGETLYPGWVANVTEVLVNGEPIPLIAKPYTASDDQKCTRVNLYNEWVTDVPPQARTVDGDLTGTAPTIIDGNMGRIETLAVTFEYTEG